MSDKIKIITEIKSQIEELNKKLDTILGCNEEDDSSEENISEDILEILEINKLHDMNIKGKGINVGIIDTNFKSFTGVLEYKNLYNPNGAAKEVFGHGTMVSSIIKRIAPEANFYGCITDGDLSVSQMKSINSSLRWCIDNKMDVINISQGYISSILTSDYDSVISDMKELIKEAYSKNIIIVCSCGNSGYKEDVDTVSVPAALDCTIAVGSVNKALEWSSFSSTGSTVDVVSIGENTKVINANGEYHDYEGGGTSFSCPVVTGIAALMKQQNINLCFVDILFLFKEYALDLGTIGKDNAYGFGLVKGIIVPSDYELINNEEESPIVNVDNLIFNNMNINEMHNAGIKGKGIKIAICGYGCKKLDDLNVYKYLDLSGENSEWVSAQEPVGDIMTSLIASKSIGICPEAEVYVLRTKTSEGWSMVSSVNNDAKWCVQNKMDIAILSPYTPIDIIKTLNNMGTIVVIPSYKNVAQGVFAGQNTENDYVISVSYVNSDNKYITSPQGQVAYASKYVDCCGYGFGFEYIDSSGNKMIFDGSDYSGAVWRTSFAACQVAGVIALLKQQDSTLSSAEKVRSILKDVCLDTLTAGFDEKTGYGLIRGVKI